MVAVPRFNVGFAAGVPVMKVSFRVSRNYKAVIFLPNKIKYVQLDFSAITSWVQ